MGNTDPRVAIKTLAAIISKLIQNIDTRVTLAQTSANANLAKSANLSDVASKQTALNNLANAIQANTNEYVLTKDTATGNIILKAISLASIIKLVEQSIDPPNPPQGQSVIWQSDGTGTGESGDILMKITVGAVTKTLMIAEFSVLN